MLEKIFGPLDGESATYDSLQPENHEINVHSGLVVSRDKAPTCQCMCGHHDAGPRHVTITETVPVTLVLAGLIQNVTSAVAAGQG